MNPAAPRNEPRCTRRLSKATTSCSSEKMSHKHLPTSSRAPHDRFRSDYLGVPLLLLPTSVLVPGDGSYLSRATTVDCDAIGPIPSGGPDPVWDGKRSAASNVTILPAQFPPRHPPRRVHSERGPQTSYRISHRCNVLQARSCHKDEEISELLSITLFSKFWECNFKISCL